MKVKEFFEMYNIQCGICSHLIFGQCEEATHIGLIHETWPIDDVDWGNGQLCECFKDYRLKDENGKN